LLFANVQHAAQCYDYAPHLWPLALPLGVAITAAAWRWRADRPPERAYVLAVGAAATLWTAAASCASPAHAWLVLTALAGAAGAGLPPWWHYRRRGKVTTTRGAPRRTRRELRRIAKNWPELAEYMELAGSHVQRAEADSIGFTFTLALRAGLTAADVMSKLPRIESVLEARPGAARLLPDPAHAHRAFLRVVRDDPLAAPIPWPGASATSVNAPIVLGRFEDGDPVRVRLVGEHTMQAALPRGSPRRPRPCTALLEHRTLGREPCARLPRRHPAWRLSSRARWRWEFALRRARLRMAVVGSAVQ
jgi:hypothetical protein